MTSYSDAVLRMREIRTKAARESIPTTTPFCWYCGGCVGLYGSNPGHHTVELRCMDCGYVPMRHTGTAEFIEMHYLELYRAYLDDYGCAHCGEAPGRHVNGKCLFGPTTYKPRIRYHGRGRTNAI